MKKWILLAGVLLLGLFGCAKNEEAFGYVSIHINPKIDILLDDSQTVTHYALLNEEAKVLLAGEDLKGLAVNDAIDKILDLAIQTGYIDVFSTDNVVSVFATDTEDVALQDQVESHIQNYLNSKAIATAVVLQTAVDASLKQIGEDQGVSDLQAKMIQTYLAMNNGITTEEAKVYSVGELLGFLKTNFDDSLASFRSTRESEYLTLKELLIEDLSDLLDLFEEGVENGTITLPDMTGLKDRFMQNYLTEIAAILTRNQERIDYVESKVDGTVSNYVIGKFECGVSTSHLPYTINYYTISFNEVGTYFESWSITANGQTSTSDYIGSWSTVDGKLSLSGQTLFRFFLSGGNIVAYDDNGDRIEFYRTNAELRSVDIEFGCMKRILLIR